MIIIIKIIMIIIIKIIMIIIMIIMIIIISYCRVACVRFRLEYEQSRLLGRIKELVSTFDADLRVLRHEKFKMDIVMKNADLRYADTMTIMFFFFLVPVILHSQV